MNRQEMATYLGLNPQSPDSWPTDLLDRLINLERVKGQDKLMREVRNIVTPPKKRCTVCGR